MSDRSGGKPSPTLGTWAGLAMRRVGYNDWNDTPELAGSCLACRLHFAIERNAEDAATANADNN